jgi:hypothetical protein
MKTINEIEAAAEIAAKILDERHPTTKIQEYTEENGWTYLTWAQEEFNTIYDEIISQLEETKETNPFEQLVKKMLEHLENKAENSKTDFVEDEFIRQAKILIK